MEGLIFGGAYLRREICFSKSIGLAKRDWASLIVGSKCAVFALFYFVFEGNFPSTSARGGGGGPFLEERFNGGIFALPVWGLIFRGAYGSRPSVY